MPRKPITFYLSMVDGEPHLLKGAPRRGVDGSDVGHPNVPTACGLTPDGWFVGTVTYVAFAVRCGDCATAVAALTLALE